VWGLVDFLFQGHYWGAVNMLNSFGNTMVVDGGIWGEASLQKRRGMRQQGNQVNSPGKWQGRHKGGQECRGVLRYRGSRVLELWRWGTLEYRGGGSYEGGDLLEVLKSRGHGLLT